METSEKSTAKKGSNAGKVVKIILNVILWLFVAFAVVITIFVFTSQNSKDGLPSIGGKCIVTVVSDSMNPTFKAGDLIIVDRLTTEEKKECEVGDIITFYSDLNGDGEDEVNTHRIVSTREANGYVYYTTKGDNKSTNPINDNYEVVSINVCGKYSGKCLTGVGTVINFLQKPTGFLCVIVLPLVLFFLFELYRFILVTVSLKKSKISAREEEAIKQKAIEEYLKSQQANSEENKPEESQPDDNK